MNKRLFYWSLADEAPSLCDRSRILLWKIGIGIMLWVMLFGKGTLLD